MDTTILSQSGESVEPYAYMKIDEKAEETDAKIYLVELVDQQKFDLSKEVPLEFDIDIKNPNMDENQSTMDYNSIYCDDLEKAGDILTLDTPVQTEETIQKLCTGRMKLVITGVVLLFVIFLILIGTVTAVSTLISVNK